MNSDTSTWETKYTKKHSAFSPLYLSTLLIVLVLVGTVATIRAIGQKGIPPLTDSERLNLRNLAARRAIAYQELQQSPIYTAAQESSRPASNSNSFTRARGGTMVLRVKNKSSRARSTSPLE